MIFAKRQKNTLSLSHLPNALLHSNLQILRAGLLVLLILLVLSSTFSPANAQAAQDLVLNYTFDRSAVPQLTYNAITLKIYIGSAQSVSATADGQPDPLAYNPQTGYAVVTTAGSSLRVVARGAARTAQFGTFTKTIFRDDKTWAWSHGFDDNVNFKLHGIPAFESYGWRATIYLIGNEISDTRNESWIVDKPDIMALVKKGWAIGNHTWSHKTVSDVGGQSAAAADITRLDSYLRQAVDQAGRSDYRLMSFAAPMFDSAYLPILLSLRNSKTTSMLFDDSGNNFYLRMDPGAVEPQYGRFTAFDYNGAIGRDIRINSFGDGSSDDQNFRADIAQMTGSANSSHHYWLNTFSHGVDDQYPSAGIFAFLPWLYNNYGPGGKNTVWVAPAEEVYSYRLVYDNIKISAASPTPVSYTNKLWLPLLKR